MSVAPYPALQRPKQERCPHCGGSMYVDPIDECWVCMMCARSMPLAVLNAPAQMLDGPGADGETTATAVKRSQEAA